MSTFPPRALQFPGSTSGGAALLFGNASVGTNSATGGANVQLTPNSQYYAGAAYLPDAWPMTSFGRYGGFDANFTVLIDETVGQGADGIAFIFRAGDAPRSSSSGGPDMMFYGGTIPPEGSFTIHFDTYQNVPVWNEPSADFVAVYRDQDNVYDNRLCSRVQNPSAPIPFKDTPLNIRISLLGPGLLTPGSTNNVPDPSRQSRLRVNYWSEGESEPAIPLLECGIDTGSIFKTSTLGEQNRRVWVGAASLTGESANRHLIESASARYCDVQNAAPTSGLVQACTCNPNSTLSGTTCVANSTSSSGLSVGAIVGIAIGGVAALLLAAGLAWYFLRKKPAKPVAVDGLTDVESKAPVTVSSADKPVAAPPATVVFPTTTASALPTAATAYATPPTLLAAAGTAAAPKSEIPFNTAALSPSQGITPGTEMVCVMPYVPSQTDEMVLNRGDRIAVVEVFEDGWAVGENTTTRARGHFPLAAAIRADELGS